MPETGLLGDVCGDGAGAVQNMSGLMGTENSHTQYRTEKNVCENSFMAKINQAR